MAIALVVASGCASRLPRPPFTQVQASTYVPVPFPPRAVRVEVVPPRPVKDAVWVDGSWEFTGGDFQWRGGGWVVPPKGAKLARWVLVRRRDDGQLYFAPDAWFDAAGQPIRAPRIVAPAKSQLDADD